MTDETLAAFLDGQLEKQQLDELQVHLARCPSCLALVSAAAGTTSTLPPERAPTLSAPGEARPRSGLFGMAPQSLDELRLIRALGRGMMGEVFLYRDTFLDRPVAVKFLATTNRSEAAQARFLNEARALARLSHPNVVALYRVGQAAAGPYLVSEFVDGHPLTEEACPVPWPRVLALGQGMAHGLAAAHKSGVIHRDLKPANIMVTRDGRAKLLDFGLAQLLDALGSEEGWATAFVGTPRYMAPEVLRGEIATPRSDVYALGLILHELCVGELPSDPAARAGPELTSVEAQGAVLRRAGVDAKLVQIILRCLRHDPTERFPDAVRLVAALDALAPPQHGAGPAEPNPYRGLLPFLAEHREQFHGRENEVREVIERLRMHPVILVAGDSGIGKSSLCRAGVLPRVAEGALGTNRNFVAASMVPGRRPATALTELLIELLGTEQPPDPLHDSVLVPAPELPAELLAQLRAPSAGQPGVLIFVDQAEELLTQSDPAEAGRFDALFAELASTGDAVRLLLAVRGDFVTRLAALPGIADQIQRGFYFLRPLSEAGIREAIVGPARRSGVRFESEELVEELVQTAVVTPGSLPLLQFTLAELWERLDASRGCIPKAALAALGGVGGSLARHADGVMLALPPALQVQARRLLLCLTGPDDVRLRRFGSELGLDHPDAAAALEALIRGRLVMASGLGGETAFELAHEALLIRWGTLRDWLQQAAGRRPVLARLGAAAKEWARLGRTREGLWRSRQLAETQVLEPSELSPREAEFLAASRRYVLRRRLLQLGAVVAVPLLLGASFLLVQLRAHYQNTQRTREALAAAQKALHEGRTAAQQASERRVLAMARFDAFVPAQALSTASESRQQAERLWADVLALMQGAEAAFLRADQTLETALARSGRTNELADRLGEVTYERLRLAEQSFQSALRGQLDSRLRLYDPHGTWRKRIDAPAELTLVTAPAAGMRILRESLTASARSLIAVPGPASTPISRVSLLAGTYQLLLAPEGGPEVRLPLRLQAGARQKINLRLPRALPAGFAYVPPGCFLFGSSDEESLRQSFFDAPPLHERCTGAYLIARNEVSFAEWIRFLRALPPAERLRRTPRSLSEPDGRGLLKLEEDAAGLYTLHIQPTTRRLIAAEGQPVRYESRRVRAAQDWGRFPVVGISLQDALAYLRWLDTTGELPGARLCDEYEWERAGRGADERIFPHGNRLLPDDANYDETYGRAEQSFGPDEVGAHPGSRSPYGVDDLVGNVYELVRSVRAEGEVVIRGSAWYYAALTQRLYNRNIAEPSTRSIFTGLRLCADVPSGASDESPSALPQESAPPK